MDLNKIRRMAGVQETFGNKKVEMAKHIPTSKQMSLTENVKMSDDDVKKVEKAVLRVVDYLEAEVDNISDRQIKASYHKDIADYDKVHQDVQSGDHSSAVRIYSGMDTAGRDFLTDQRINPNKEVRQMLASYFKFHLLPEGCGSPHGENEEVIGDDEKEEGMVTCPICSEEVSKAEFYDHMMDNHEEVMKKDEKEPEEEMPDEEKAEDEEGCGGGMTMQFEEEKLEEAKEEDKKEKKEEKKVDKKPKAKKKVEKKVVKKKAKKKSVPKAVDATVYDTMDTDDSPESKLNVEEGKVKIPANIKSRMSEEIKELRDEAEKCKEYDFEKAKFLSITADAFDTLANFINAGTAEGMVQAQHFSTTLMGPILQRVPDEVYKFIIGGGKPTSLKQLFQQVKMNNQGEK